MLKTCVECSEDNHGELSPPLSSFALAIERCRGFCQNSKHPRVFCVSSEFETAQTGRRFELPPHVFLAVRSARCLSVRRSCSTAVCKIKIRKMSHGLATAASQAEMLKDRGNIYFKKERLGAAIEAYTEAITLCPRVPVYWTNRALCHRKRNDWKRVESDCRKALELDKDSVKAHYMLGLALLQNQLYGEAVKKLEKALDLGRGGKPGNYMVEEIWQELAKARFTEWEQAASHRKQQQQELREVCESLLKEDYLSRMNEVCSRTTTAKGVEIDGVIHLDDDDSDSGSTKFREKEAVEDPLLSTKTITEQYDSRLRTLEEVFGKVGAPDSPAEVPDHLQCKITMDIFRDPVITPSGVTYERAVLLEHLRKVGKFDPLTRAPLQPEQVVPNLAIKEAVQCYLLDHGWAYRMF